MKCLKIILLVPCCFILMQCRCDKTQSVVNSGETETIPSTGKDSVKNLPPVVDLETISYSTYDNKYVFFGMPGDFGLYLQPGDELFPPIPGLRKYYAEVAGSRDTAILARFALGLRCPSGEPHLLAWVSGQAEEGVPSFFGEANPGACPSPVSVEAIGTYYIQAFKHVHEKGLPEAEQEPEAYRHAAAGLLLADCWQQGDLCTFYKAEWHEWTWYKEYYYTINAATGAVLDLADFVDPSSLETLGRLALRYLENGNGDRAAHALAISSGKELLSYHDCCALIDEGLILTFSQGTLASNAEGQFRAVIPYEQLTGILKINHHE